MLVYLHEYRTDDAGNKRTGTGDSVDHDTETYFEVDELELDEWEVVERDGTRLQRRPREFEDVTAVSLPHESSDDDLPGQTIQIRTGGDTEYVEHAELVEVQDPDP
ncbi:hypothetical protein [Halorarius halobius]|uniref:hypothetical protein n=1 Tax=Halorarius halobius TaxID=2962671 RepID=UPI0020CE6143|nr:hypothetical protein [Halorarius halobius]